MALERAQAQTRSSQPRMKCRVQENRSIALCRSFSDGFMEANVNDLVLSIIIPVIYNFECKTGHIIQGKSQDSKTGGYEEFVVVDMVSVAEEYFMLIVEAKRESLSAGMGQYLLAMKDMGDSSHCVVYGFITAGDIEL